MANPFFEHPILNSPYQCPQQHWELDSDGQPTQKIIEVRRRAEFITPIPKPKKRKAAAASQQAIVFDEGAGLSTQKQQYDATSIINEVRGHVAPEMPFERSLEIERRLDDVLRLMGTGQFSTPKLAEAVGVSIPTISRCVTALRERGHDIQAERYEGGWRYVLARSPKATNRTQVEGKAKASITEDHYQRSAKGQR